MSRSPGTTAARARRRFPSLRGYAVGIGPGRNAANSSAEPTCGPHRGAGGWSDQDWARCGRCALLGADEFGFATAPLVVGLHHDGKCHLNTCPVGVATQDPELRKEVHGSARTRGQLFFFVAEEVREIMGLARRALVQRADRAQRSTRYSQRHRALEGQGTGLLARVPPHAAMPKEFARYHVESQDHGLEGALDNQLIIRRPRRWSRKRKW